MRERLVPPGAAERGQHQRAEATEHREHSHLLAVQHLEVSTSKHGITIVARSARTAAWTDHETRHHGAPGRLGAGTAAAGPCTPVVEEAAL